MTLTVSVANSQSQSLTYMVVGVVAAAGSGRLLSSRTFNPMECHYQSLCRIYFYVSLGHNSWAGRIES